MFSKSIKSLSFLRNNKFLFSNFSISSFIMSKANESKTSFDEVENNGRFMRKPTTFRSVISKDGQYPPENDRYTLYVSYACPWANRALIFRNLKGLQKTIDVVVVEAVWGTNNPESGTKGWVFKGNADVVSIEGAMDDPYGCKSLKDLYEIADPNYSGKYTVPTLWDKKTKTIVNNESSEIIKFFNDEFQDFAENKDVDLRPENLISEIDKISDFFYNSVNNGVYRSGFARTQEAYEEAVDEVFVVLDSLEETLSKSRYLVSNDQITEADVRLFVTLIRFDNVYFGHFKCNKKHIYEYENLWNWLLELYSIDAFKNTVNMPHIKTHYYATHTMINPFSIIPKGEIDFNVPHNRNEKFPKK